MGPLFCTFYSFIFHVCLFGCFLFSRDFDWILSYTHARACAPAHARKHIHTSTNTHTARETFRQTDRQTDRQADIQPDRQPDRDREADREREMYRKPRCTWLFLLCWWTTERNIAKGKKRQRMLNQGFCSWSVHKAVWYLYFNLQGVWLHFYCQCKEQNERTPPSMFDFTFILICFGWLVRHAIT